MKIWKLLFGTLVLVLMVSFLGCESPSKLSIKPWYTYDETSWLEENANNPSERMRYKLIQSKITDKNDLWRVIEPQIEDFSENEYERLKPLILEQDIPSIQASIRSNKLTYEQLTKWYLYRIVKYENDSSTALNNIISINPLAVASARACDRVTQSTGHPIFGMPILLKDNINSTGMPTTAGSHALMNNFAPDAFIASRIIANGGIILGKTNLSEWANYLCISAPNGYSAVGGQTLNPYGPRKHDTGGSSSGSGSATAANYAVATVGTETSGSILSPSSANSAVGLKPTVGLLSRSGIVPISSTLDTPGPITKCVIDNTILLSAMLGEDESDPATIGQLSKVDYLEELKTGTLTGVRFGVIRSFLLDTLYKEAVGKIIAKGGVAIEYDAPQVSLEGFLSLLNGDMIRDMEKYLASYVGSSVSHRTMADLLAHNLSDSTIRIPYGQGRFEGILADTITDEGLANLRDRLNQSGRSYFDLPMAEHQLDFVLSANNWSAGLAAVAKYPCLTVPMGYKPSGQPMGITFIAKPFEEAALLKVGYAFEQATKAREVPANYK